MAAQQQRKSSLTYSQATLAQWQLLANTLLNLKNNS
jgi:hypothetical protein